MWEQSEEFSPSRATLRIIPVQELLSYPLPVWVVKRLIERGTRGVLYGESGAGKTFIAVDLALSIASGRPWSRFRTASGSVVYICAEGARALGRRVTGWLQYHEIKAERIEHTFKAIGTPVQLLCPPARTELQEVVIQACETAPALIVVDTLSWCLSGQDENSNAVMAQMISAAAWFQHRLAEHYGAESAVLFVHHTGKDKNNGMRGAYALKANVDFVLQLRRDRDSPVARLVTEKVKDEAKGGDLEFGTEVIRLGMDEDNEDITTCVSVAIGFAPRSQGRTQRESKAKGHSEKPSQLDLDGRRIIEAFEVAGTRVMRFHEVRVATDLHDNAIDKALKKLCKQQILKRLGGRKGYELLTSITPDDENGSGVVFSHASSFTHHTHHTGGLVRGPGEEVSNGVELGKRQTVPNTSLRYVRFACNCGTLLPSDKHLNTCPNAFKDSFGGERDHGGGTSRVM